MCYDVVMKFLGNIITWVAIVFLIRAGIRADSALPSIGIGAAVSLVGYIFIRWLTFIRIWGRDGARVLILPLYVFVIDLILATAFYWVGRIFS